MTTTGYPLRTGRLRRADALVKVPSVLIAAVLWLMVIEALRGLAAWGVLAVVVGGTVAAVVAESVIVRLVWWARRPSTPLAVPGDQQVQVLVTGRRAAGIGQSGRRHLIVPAAWVGRTDLPALLAGARLRQMVSASRFEVAYQWFTWPWLTLASFISGFAHGLSRLPLIGFAWRMRFVITGIAVWQTIVTGQHAATVGIVAVIGLTYLLPWTKTHHERLVRQALADLQRPSPMPATPATWRPAALPVQPVASLEVAGLLVVTRQGWRRHTSDMRRAAAERLDVGGRLEERSPDTTSSPSYGRGGRPSRHGCTHHDTPTRPIAPARRS